MERGAFVQPQVVWKETLWARLEVMIWSVSFLTFAWLDGCYFISRLADLQDSNHRYILYHYIYKRHSLSLFFAGLQCHLQANRYIYIYSICVFLTDLPFQLHAFRRRGTPGEPDIEQLEREDAKRRV